MDSGKDFFWHSFSLFWPQNLAVFGGHGQFSGFAVLPRMDQFSNTRMVVSNQKVLQERLIQLKESDAVCCRLCQSALVVIKAKGIALPPEEPQIWNSRFEVLP